MDHREEIWYITCKRFRFLPLMLVLNTCTGGWHSNLAENIIQSYIERLSTSNCHILMMYRQSQGTINQQDTFIKRKAKREVRNYKCINLKPTIKL